MKKIKMFILLMMLVSSVFATVPAGESIRQYFDGDGSNTEFTFTQPCNSSNDVLVYTHLIETGVEELLVEDTGYTIVATGSDYLNGGVVTIDPALASTFRVVIVREIKKSQETSTGAMNAATAVIAFDKLARITQDLQDRNDRSVHLPESDATTFDMELADLETRASTYYGFGDTGAPTYYSAAITDSATVSSYMTTLLDDATAAQAQATLLLKDGSAELAIADIITKSPWFDVRHPDFGGIGDGASQTADTAAILAAIVAAEAVGGGTIFLPDGIWNYDNATTPITLRGILKSDPEASGNTFKQIIMRGVAPETTQIVFSDTDQIGIQIEGSWNTLENIGLEGGRPAIRITGHVGDGVSVATTNNIVRNVRILNPQNGIALRAAFHTLLEKIRVINIQDTTSQEGSFSYAYGLFFRSNNNQFNSCIAWQDNSNIRGFGFVLDTSQANLFTNCDTSGYTVGKRFQGAAFSAGQSDTAWRNTFVGGWDERCTTSFSIESSTEVFNTIFMGHNFASRPVNSTVNAGSSAKQFTIVAGSAVNDAYNGFWCVVIDADGDVSDDELIFDYIGATKTVILENNLSFTPAAADVVQIYIPEQNQAMSIFGNFRVQGDAFLGNATGDLVRVAGRIYHLRGSNLWEVSGSGTDLNIFGDNESGGYGDLNLVTNGGNVSVGPTTAAAKLHVDNVSGAIPVLTLDQGDDDDVFINYIGTSAGDGTKSISSDTTEDSSKFGAIRIEINGSTKWIRIYDNES